MFALPRNFAMTYNSLPNTNKIILRNGMKLLYSAARPLPIPNNIDADESTRFSPQRSRDISEKVMLSHGMMNSFRSPLIDITTDNSNANIFSSTENNLDPHIQSYDCFGAISLNSAMQSNVPTPFGGMHKFTHLNMPGGQWSQEYKFTAQNLHSSHYTTLRSNARSTWGSYDQNVVITNKDHSHLTNRCVTAIVKRSYTTKSKNNNNNNGNTEMIQLSKKERFKQAIKDYGSTVVIFHVGISLLSLGGCYMLISGGIDIVPILEYLGLGPTLTKNNILAGGSTFVVAYAVHKIFAPVRISITLGATPFIVKYLRSKGILKTKMK